MLKILPDFNDIVKQQADIVASTEQIAVFDIELSRDKSKAFYNTSHYLI